MRALLDALRRTADRMIDRIVIAAERDRLAATVLLGLADALAMTGEDAGALLAIGLSEAQSEDVRGCAGDSTEVLPGGDSITAATKRLGRILVAELRARGRAVPAGERVRRRRRTRPD